MIKRNKQITKVAVLGYGSQGRAVALNLNDSGFEVTVGLRGNSKIRKVARKDGIKTISTIPSAVSGADLIIMAIPDQTHQPIFKRYVAPNLKRGAMLLFLHGMSIHFRLVVPPKNIDVAMLAPHAPGLEVRYQYGKGNSISAFYAIHQNYTKQARQRFFAIAKGVGFAQNKLVKTTFKDEAIGDIFGEQAVLCGGLASLIKAGFDTLVKNGLKTEHAYLEVAYQLDLIIKLIKNYGIEGMFSRISITAQYGSSQAGPEIINSETRDRMQKLYERIASGEFVSELSQLDDKGMARMRRDLKKLTRPALEKAARKYSK